jgi:hypothetical protein
VIICFRAGDEQHCYDIPVVELPISFPRLGPGPINIPWLIQDAVLIASLQAAVSHAYDDDVRDALKVGIDAAMQALQNRAGDHVEISDGTAGGPPTGGGAQGPGRD